MNALFSKPWYLLSIFLFGAIFVLGWGKLHSVISEPAQPITQVSPSTLSVNGETWTIIGVAKTEAERARGLSLRDPLALHTGLLFVFSEPGRYSFWMKDMRFPLDIIFIREGKVDSIARNRQPDDLTPIPPQGPITEVLEVNAGEATSLSPGDAVQLVY